MATPSAAPAVPRDGHPALHPAVRRPADESPVRSGTIGLLLALALDALVAGAGAAAGGVHMARHADSYPTLYGAPELAAGAVMLALAVLLVQVVRVSWTRTVDWKVVLVGFGVLVLPVWNVVVWLAGTVATSLR